jgi:hypothetical protein
MSLMSGQAGVGSRLGRRALVYALAAGVLAVVAIVVAISFAGGTPKTVRGVRRSGVGTARRASSSAAADALPTFPGKASPVIGRVSDPTAGISFAQLGKPWAFSTLKETVGGNPFDDQGSVITDTFRAAGKQSDWGATIYAGGNGSLAMGTHLVQSSITYHGPADLMQTASAILTKIILPSFTQPGASPTTSHFTALRSADGQGGYSGSTFRITSLV